MNALPRCERFEDRVRAGAVAAVRLLRETARERCGEAIGIDRAVLLELFDNRDRHRGVIRPSPRPVARHEPHRCATREIAAEAIEHRSERITDGEPE
jgi:hypothetical protein